MASVQLLIADLWTEGKATKMQNYAWQWKLLLCHGTKITTQKKTLQM